MSLQIRVRDLAVGVMLVAVGLIAGLTVRPSESRAQSQVCQVASGGVDNAYVACGSRVFVCRASRCSDVSFF